MVQRLWEAAWFLICASCGLNCVSSNFFYWKPNTQYLRTWPFEGYGVHRANQVKMRSLGWAPIQYDWCPYKKKKFGCRDSHTRASQVVLVVKNPPANSGDLRDMGSVPGSGTSPGKGHGNPLQYSCLENSMDRVSGQAEVHGVAQSRTWLKRLSMQHTQSHIEGRPCEDTGGWQPSTSLGGRPGTAPSLTALRRNQPYQNFDFRLASRTVREWVSVV